MSNCANFCPPPPPSRFTAYKTTRTPWGKDLKLSDILNDLVFKSKTFKWPPATLGYHSNAQIWRIFLSNIIRSISCKSTPEVDFLLFPWGICCGILSLMFRLRGAWSDRDTNDIFAHCSLIFYYLDFKFSNFVCPSEPHPLIWFFLKNSFRKKKNIWITSQNALAPSIFIVLSIVLKLGTPLLHIQAQNTLLQNF